MRCLPFSKSVVSQYRRLDRGDCAVLEKNGDAEFGPAIGVAAAARCGGVHHMVGLQPEHHGKSNVLGKTPFSELVAGI